MQISVKYYISVMFWSVSWGNKQPRAGLNEADESLKTNSMDTGIKSVVLRLG